MTSLPEVLEKLEPCPFCGREATVENPEEGCYAIGCDDCCFSMMAGNVGIGWYATRAEAITAWNTRPALLRDAGDGSAALGLLSRMRFACGDNGLRMQDELEEYLRGLAGDAARYRWLRKHAEVFMPGVKTATNTLYRGDYSATWDAAIDAAMHAPGGAGERGVSDASA